MEDFLVDAATVAVIGSLILISLLFLCLLFCLGKQIGDWIIKKIAYRKSYYRHLKHYICKNCGTLYISSLKFKKTKCSICGEDITKKECLKNN